MKTFTIQLFGIITFSRYNDYQKPLNVPYPDLIKKLIRKKKAYSTDVEKEENSISRKVVLSDLNLNSLKELGQSIGFVYSCDTMGSLTLEYGHLPAISLETENYPDCYGNDDRTGLYISAFFNVEQDFYDSLSVGEQNKLKVICDAWDNWLKSDKLNFETEPPATEITLSANIKELFPN